MIPLTNIEEEETGLDPQYNEHEELEFSWNEKIFSPREFKHYSEETNCDNSLQREYHSRIRKLIDEGVKTPENRLFSYTSGDEIPSDVRIQFDVFLSSLRNTIIDACIFDRSYVEIFFTKTVIQVNLNFIIVNLAFRLENRTMADTRCR